MHPPTNTLTLIMTTFTTVTFPWKGRGGAENTAVMSVEDSMLQADQDHQAAKKGCCGRTATSAGRSNAGPGEFSFVVVHLLFVVITVCWLSLLLVSRYYAVLADPLYLLPHIVNLASPCSRTARTSCSQAQ